MNEQTVKGNWNQVVGHAKQRWSELKDEDIGKAEGQVDELVGIIQERTGEARQQVERALSEFATGASSKVDRAADSAGDYAELAFQQAREACESLSHESEKRLSEARELVRTKPTESMLVSFGVGIVAGVFVGMAMRR